MPHLRVTVGSRQGHHARSATLFVRAAARQPVKVTVGRPGRPAVDTRSPPSVPALGAAQGDTLQLTADGDEVRAVPEEPALPLPRDRDG
jgi:phosphocarrier protein HPr